MIEPRPVAVSYGYGLSLLWQAVCLLPYASTLSPSLCTLLAAYAAYGVKVCCFQALRDRSPAYVAKVLAPARERQSAKTRGKVPALGISASRAPFAAGVAVLLSTFSFPLLATIATSGPTGSPLALLGALAALAGLAFQTVADAQKWAFKRACGADALCTTGLWYYSRHANYLGEIAFQVGVLLAGLGGALASGAWRCALARACLSLLAPLTFISIMIVATRSLEARQLEAYADSANYREYVRTTPRLFVGVERSRRALAATRHAARRVYASARRRWRGLEEWEEWEESPSPTETEGESVWASRAAQAASASESIRRPRPAFVDVNREALEERERAEGLGEEIGALSAITGLAGVAAVAIALLGTLLL